MYDEELGLEPCDIGIHTLPPMESPFPATEDALAEMRKTASWLAGAGKFFVALGGEHALTTPLVAGVAEHHPGVTVLQIDAHADLRDSYMGDPYSHASAMRRTLDARPVRAGGHPEPLGAGGGGGALAQHDHVLRLEHARRPALDGRSRGRAGRKVYLTIDLDGLDPAIMPAVGTPEPGGLSWREMTGLVKKVMRQRTVVAATWSNCARFQASSGRTSWPRSWSTS